jgi:hypothetical protein
MVPAQLVRQVLQAVAEFVGGGLDGRFSVARLRHLKFTH